MMDHCNDALAQCSSFFRSAEQKNSSILNFWQKVLAGQKVKVFLWVCPQLSGSPLHWFSQQTGQEKISINCCSSWRHVESSLQLSCLIEKGIPGNIFLSQHWSKGGPNSCIMQYQRYLEPSGQTPPKLCKSRQIHIVTYWWKFCQKGSLLKQKKISIKFRGIKRRFTLPFCCY